jgi:hypothetical protein
MPCCEEDFFNLEKLGFDPYIAVAEQTLRGLKENQCTCAPVRLSS